MTDGTSDAPEKQSDERLPIALGAGSLIAGWDFCMMFGAWVVTSQAEIVAGNIFFFCLGVMPLFGIIGSFRRKLWGPRMLIISPLAASIGFLFLSNVDSRTIVFATLLFLAPTIVIGIILLKLIHQRVQSVDVLKQETSN